MCFILQAEKVDENPGQSFETHHNNRFLGKLSREENFETFF
jgi:hypothetical protein